MRSSSLPSWALIWSRASLNRINKAISAKRRNRITQVFCSDNRDSSKWKRAKVQTTWAQVAMSFFWVRRTYTRRLKRNQEKLAPLVKLPSNIQISTKIRIKGLWAMLHRLILFHQRQVKNIRSKLHLCPMFLDFRTTKKMRLKICKDSIAPIQFLLSPKKAAKPKNWCDRTERKVLWTQ